jgi:putative ABC transport system substrate-binding protein
MRRRDFIAVVAGLGATLPLVAHAQQPTMAVIGFLGTTTANDFADRVAAFREGLKQVGYIEGQNVAIEYRWPEGRYDRLPTLAADLVQRQVAVIVAGGPPAAHATRAATSTIPIVFTSGDDPVGAGLVSSFNRPGGNITGVHLFLTELNAKKLGLMRDLLPHVNAMAVLLNPTSQNANPQAKELQTAARALGLQIDIFNASSESEIEAAFTTLVQQRLGALIVGNDPFFVSRREQIVALAASHSVPVVYDLREYADAGGLMTYGTNLKNAYRQAGVYVGRILNGEKPADLPVLRSTNFEFVINLKAAKALGLTFPPGLLAIADEVIE